MEGLFSLIASTAEWSSNGLKIIKALNLSGVRLPNRTKLRAWLRKQRGWKPPLDYNETVQLVGKALQEAELDVIEGNYMAKQRITNHPDPTACTVISMRDLGESKIVIGCSLWRETGHMYSFLCVRGTPTPNGFCSEVYSVQQLSEPTMLISRTNFCALAGELLYNIQFDDEVGGRLGDPIRKTVTGDEVPIESTK